MQTALSPTLWSLRIDWVLVVVVCITLLRGFAVGLHWALIGGLALDLLSPLPIGAHLLGLLLAVTVVALVGPALAAAARALCSHLGRRGIDAGRLLRRQFADRRRTHQ